MSLYYISVAGRGACDAVLAKVVEQLTQSGLRLAGTVQHNLENPATPHCDMDLQVLPDGPVYRISQSLGAGSRGCRLNPESLELSVAQVARRMAGAQLLVINKFGKHESEGRGFRPLIGEAIGDGLPVLLGVNALNLPGFLEFAEGMATELPPDPAAICDRLCQLLQITA